MVPSASSTNLRRLGLYGLILLALTLVSTVAFVILTDEAGADGDDAFRESVTLHMEKRPEFTFPESVRTFDVSLNRFVDRFARICVTGKYSEFRLMWTHRGDPTKATRFETIFNAVKNIRIQTIEKLPEMPGIEGPAYIMLAQYELEPYADPDRPERIREVQLAITMEGGKWRIGPIPGAVLERLNRALRSGASDPRGPESASSRPASDATWTPTQRPAANRPARVGSSGRGPT